MKNLTNTNALTRALFLVCALGLAGAIETSAFAKLSKQSEFEAVESDELDEDEIEEEVVVVRPAPKKRRRVIRQEEEVEVIPAAPASTVNVTANATAAPEAKVVAVAQEDESTGGKIGKMINSKIDEKRRKHEEDMRRKQKEDEDKLVSRIGSALDKDEPGYEEQQAQAQAQSQQVIVQDKQAYNTTADDEYVSDISGSTTSKSSSSNAPAITISPNIGMGMLSAEGYEVSNGTAVGLSADFGVDDNVVINVGYTYTQYEIGIAPSGTMYNGFNNYYQGFGNNAYLNNNLSKLEYNQNVIDAGMKYLMFDRSSRIRPYVGGGLGYMKGYLNYPQKTLNSFAQAPMNTANATGQLEDYEISGWTAYLQLGALVNFSDNFGLGVNYKYHKLISSSESTRINNYGFVNNGYGYPLAQQTEKDFVSGSLAESDFHTLGLSLNLSF